MEILELLKIGSQQLRNYDINSCRLDSEILLAKIFKKKREELLINLSPKVALGTIKNFKKLITRRSFKEPIAYILKEKEFWSKNFLVDKNTLIPRPETELMVEKVVNIFKKKTGVRILDIGTGTGCILLSILGELKNASIHVTPLSVLIMAYLGSLANALFACSYKESLRKCLIPPFTIFSRCLSSANKS